GSAQIGAYLGATFAARTTASPPSGINRAAAVKLASAEKHMMFYLASIEAARAFLSRRGAKCARRRPLRANFSRGEGGACVLAFRPHARAAMSDTAAPPVQAPQASPRPGGRLIFMVVGALMIAFGVAAAFAPML